MINQILFITQDLTPIDFYSFNSPRLSEMMQRNVIVNDVHIVEMRK